MSDREPLSPAKSKAMVKTNLELLSKNRALGISDLETLNRITTSHKAVAAVWDYDFEPDYLEILFIKGCEQGFTELPDDEVSAVHCCGTAEAILMKRAFGDDDWQEAESCLALKIPAVPGAGRLA
jgi:hypothetical protein